MVIHSKTMTLFAATLGLGMLVLTTAIAAQAAMPGQIHLISYVGMNQHYHIFVSENHGHVKAMCKHNWWRGPELWLDQSAIVRGTSPHHIRFFAKTENCEAQILQLGRWFLNQEYPFQKSIHLQKTADDQLELDFKNHSPDQAIEIFHGQQDQLMETTRDALD